MLRPTGRDVYPGRKTQENSAVATNDMSRPATRKPGPIRDQAAPP
jgi:hypothetical protein